MKKLFIATLFTLILVPLPDAYAARKGAECKKLMAYTSSGKLKKVRELVDLLCDVNIITKDNMTPLMTAAYNGHYEIVKLLLKEGARVNIMDTGESGGFTALMMATIQGRYAIVKVLLQHGANPNIPRENGKTALMGAIESEYMAISKLLLDNGANVNMIDNEDTTALMIAKRSENIKLIRLLKNYGAKKIEDLRE